MKNKLKINKSLSVVALICCIAIVAFYFENVAEKSVSEVTTITLSYDYPVANDLSQMMNEAELIVIGSYASLESTWNMARDMDDITKEDSQNYVEGRLYNFNIQEVIKGNVNTESILVNHRYFETVKTVKNNAKINGEGLILKEATESSEFKFDVYDPLFIEPNSKSTYMLFLLKDRRCMPQDWDFLIQLLVKC